MPRPSRSVALVCIALVAMAALLPGISALDHAWFEAQWVLLPDETPAASPMPPAPGAEQPLGLIATRVSRGPPSTSVA